MEIRNSQFHILIVDDEMEQREVLQMILESKGYSTQTCESASSALNNLERNRYDLVLSDFIMPEMNGLELLKKIKKSFKDTEVIILTGYGSIENAVEAMKEGAFTYIIKGSDPEEMLLEIEKIKKIKLLEDDNRLLRSQMKNTDFMLSTHNKKLQKVIEIAEKAAVSNANILILGESGVGKEVLAQHIHRTSHRNHSHFLAVNCHAFNDNLLESELFGYEKGSFTGAYHSRKGKFEAAHGGTLFLDEVGDISLNTQVKLLRILESKTVERIGSNRPIYVDFRLISATNKNLRKEIQNENFRDDLFYRLSTIVIEIPPLRERKEDLPMFIDFFLESSKNEMKKHIKHMEKPVMDFLMEYDYPGNIRELKNLIERLVVLSEDGVIRKIDLPESRKIEAYNNDFFQDIRPLKEIRKDLEAKYIEQALEKCGYNMSETADKLMISRRQLFNKLTEYGLR